MRLPVTARAPALARDHLAGLLHEWGREEDAFTASLLVGELVTNAVRYSWGPVTLTVAVSGDRLRCAVHDTNPDHPRLMPQNADREGGRGMEMVAALSDNWCVRGEPGGKAVWFELTTPGPAGEDARVRFACSGCGCLVERGVVVRRCPDPACGCARLPHSDDHE